MIINRLDLLEELHDHAEKFLMENFGIHLNIPIHINNRLQTTGGRFKYLHNRAIDIEIAKFICENATKEEILNVLEHECIHYALFEMGVPCSDNDTDFIDTCKRLNVSLGHSIGKKQYIFACPDCGTIIYYYRKIPKGYYMECTHCDGKITQKHVVSIKSMRVRQVI